MKEYRISVEKIKKEKSEGTVSFDNSEKFASSKISKDKLEDRNLYDLTSLDECLNIALYEYGIERNKKQSFENRAGLIITIIMAIVIAIYDKISLKEILLILGETMTFLILIDILTTLLIYTFLIIAFYYAILIIKIKSFDNFDITTIDSHFVKSAKIDSVSKLLESYLNLVIYHRNKNAIFAEQLARSQLAFVCSVGLIVINLSLL